MEMTRLDVKFGRLYRKHRTLPSGARVYQNTWTARYQGVDYATGETEPARAEKFLMKLPAKIAADERAGKSRDQAKRKVLMGEVLDLAVAKWRRKGIASARQNEQQVTLHTRPHFGAIEATKLSTSDIERYVDQRRDGGASYATINRDLAGLKFALRLAVNHEPPLITRFPKIELFGQKLLKVREGFLAHQQYLKLKAALPDYLVPVFVVGYYVGRRRGELCQVELREVDLDSVNPHFRVYRDTTKSGKGDVVPVYGEMVPVLRAHIARTKREFPECQWLFHNQGVQILSFYKAWQTAVESVGLPDLLFHDLRRSASRNLRRAGNSEEECMRITGHLTREMFRRYAIIDESDMNRAVERAASYMEQQDALVVPASPLVS